MRLKIFIFLLLVFLVFSCHHSSRHRRVYMGFSLSPIIIYTNSQMISFHDGHIHDEFCGHKRRWFNDRWVYYYNGQWEYYDEKEGVYYYVPDALIENSDG